MNSFWSEQADYIVPFDNQHFLYISIVIVFLIALLTNQKKIKLHANIIRKVTLIVFTLQQIMLYTWYVFETGFDLSESLPLHLSRITSLLAIYFLLTKRTQVLNIIFFFGLYAYGSFLYPQRVYRIDHLIGLSFLVNHLITLLLPYFAYIAYDWRPRFMSLLKSYLWFVIYLIFVYLLNPLIDGNYFYLKYRPFFGDWPDYFYIPSILIISFAGFSLAYLVVRFIGYIQKLSLDSK